MVLVCLSLAPTYMYVEWKCLRDVKAWRSASVSNPSSPSHAMASHTHRHLSSFPVVPLIRRFAPLSDDPLCCPYAGGLTVHPLLPTDLHGVPVSHAPADFLLAVLVHHRAPSASPGRRVPCARGRGVLGQQVCRLRVGRG